jgi:hypothetical protein
VVFQFNTLAYSDRNDLAQTIRPAHRPSETECAHCPLQTLLLLATQLCKVIYPCCIVNMIVSISRSATSLAARLPSFIYAAGAHSIYSIPVRTHIHISLADATTEQIKC